MVPIWRIREEQWFDQGHTRRACAYIWKWFGEASESKRSGNVFPYNSWKKPGRWWNRIYMPHAKINVGAQTGRKRWPFHFNARNEIRLCGCHHSGIGQASRMQHSNENSLSKRNIFNRKKKKRERMMSGIDPTPNCKGFSEPRYKQNPSDFWLTRLSYLGQGNQVANIYFFWMKMLKVNFFHWQLTCIDYLLRVRFCPRHLTCIVF